MLTCNLQGGLGNQLFQIFTTIAFSLKLSEGFFFQNKHQLTNDTDIQNGATIRYTYWETLLSTLKPFVKDLDKLPKLELYIKEQQFNYDPSILTNLLNSDKHLVKMLVGYFQSSKYFDNYRDQIIRLLKIPNKQLVTKAIHETNINFDNTISIHFRLGDYKKLPNIYPILTVEYYIKSINYVINQTPTNKKTAPNKTILYFCENTDHDDVLQIIHKLQHIFTELIFERADNMLSDWEQMLLMSLCYDNIIANSTFSWWAAYLNPNPCKTVCYPSEWFQSKTGNNTTDLCPEDWSVIDTSL